MLIKGIFSGSFDCPLYTGFTVAEILMKVAINQHQQITKNA
jgi:hypothetical protein